MATVPAFIEATMEAFASNKSLVERAIVQLDDSQLRAPLDENTNSIAVIMKHVAGNLRSRWTDFLTTDGEKESRDRDSEFIDTFASRDDLIAFWEEGWRSLFSSLQSLSEEDLTRTVYIRREPHTVPKAVQRSLAHTCYHIGQIVQLARFHAGEHWETLTIPKGGSQRFNESHSQKFSNGP